MGSKNWNCQTVCSVQRASFSWLQSSVMYWKWSLLNDVFKDLVIVYSPCKFKVFWEVDGSGMYCFLPFLVSTTILLVLYTCFITLIYLVWKKASSTFGCSRSYSIDSDLWGLAITTTRNTGKTRGVSHCGLASYVKKYLEAKQELWKFKYFTMQKYNPHTNPLKDIIKILQDIITL